MTDSELLHLQEAVGPGRPVLRAALQVHLAGHAGHPALVVHVPLPQQEDDHALLGAVLAVEGVGLDGVEEDDTGSRCTLGLAVVAPVAVLIQPLSGKPSQGKICS